MLRLKVCKMAVWLQAAKSQAAPDGICESLAIPWKDEEVRCHGAFF
ncbi:MAG: hypothetical protein ACK2VD_07405 [Anaerolineae bacterium]